MMRFTKRALSAFLAFVMVFTMLPLDVWATSADQSVNIGSSVDPNGRPEGAPQTYTLYVTHLLNTNIGTFVDEDVEYTLSAEDFTDGAYDPSALAYSRTGMELAEAEPVTLESFQDGKANITLTYRVADGYMAVRKNAGDVSTFAVFVGTLDDVTLVPVGSKVVLVNFVTDEGLILQPSYSEELTAESGYEFFYEIPSFPGYAPALEGTALFTLSEEGLLTADLGAQAEDNFEVTVVYTPNAIEYTVVHKFPNLTDGGYVEETQIMNGRYGEMTQAEPVEKEGFTPGEITQIPLTGEGLFTVEIEYQRNQYVLTYDTQGGSYVAPQYGKYEEELTVYSMTQGTTELTCTKEEHTHTDRCYSLFFLTCGKEEHTHSDGCYTTTPGTWDPQPTRQGYVFAGWYSDEACTQEASATLTLTQDTKVYAKWTPANVSYTIAYFAENADDDKYSYVGSVAMTAETGTTVEATAGSQKPSGFDTQHFTFYEGSSATVAPDGSTVVNAYYSRKYYTLTFIVGNRTVATLTEKYDAYIGDWWVENVGADSEYSQYQWVWEKGDGWSGDKYTIYQNNMPGEDKTCPNYEPGGSKRELYYYVEDPDGQITDPLGSGKNFRLYTKTTMYWDGNLTYNEEYFPIAGYDRYWTSVKAWQNGGNGSFGVGQTTEFYFYYSAQEYILDLYDYDGKLLSSKQVKFGTDINQYLSAAQTTPPVEGAAFKGWFTDPARTEPYEGDYKMPMGLVLYADWDLPQVKVTFKVQMGEKVETVTYGETVESYIPVVDGYTFAGWYTDENHTELFDFNQRITQDTVIYAKFTKRNTVSYTVEFVTNKGEQVAEPETHTGVVDASYTAKAVVPTGQFAGYIVDKPNDTITLKRGEENKITFTYYPAASFAYTVQYQYGDKVLYQTEPITPPAQTITVRADADVLNDLMAKGYELSGESYQQVTLSATQKNVVVFQMAPAEFTITYLSDPQGTTVTMPNNPTSYTVNTETFTLENPTLEGYRFLGWTTGQGTTPAITEPELSVSVEQGSVGHLIFIANWERSVFTIKYETDGYGTVSPESEQVNSGGNAQGSTATPNQGYYFVKWTDEDGTVVGSEEKYAPTSVTADATYTAHFAPKTAIAVKAKDFSKTYDGTRLDVPANNWAIVEPSQLPEGYNLTATLKPVTEEIIDVSDSGTNEIASVTITDASGTDVTEQFTINYLSGNLTIKPRPVTVTAQSHDFTYTGAPQSWNKYDVDGLVGEDKLTATVNGSITYPSESPVKNVVDKESIAFTTGDANNYKVSTADGELRMSYGTAQAVTVTAGSNSWTYDGNAHGENSFTIQIGESEPEKVTGNTYEFVNGDVLTVSISGSVTNVDDGTVANVITVTSIVNGSEDVSSAYSVTPHNGELKINPKAVTVTAQSHDFTYTGAPQSWNKYDVDGLVGEDKLTATVNGSITYPSESPVKNVVDKESIAFTTGDANNYKVSTADGELRMSYGTAQAVTVTAGSNSWTYDGNAHGENSFTIQIGESEPEKVTGNTYEFVNGDVLTVSISGSVTNVDDGTVANVITVTSIVNGSEDVSSAYSVTPHNGELKINPKAIEVKANPITVSYGESIPAYSIDETALEEQLVGTDTVDLIEYKLDCDYPEDGDGNALVGVYDIVFVDQKTNQDNYVVTFTPALLTVTAPSPEDFGYVTKTHEDKQYKIGDTITYTITVYNIFNSDATVSITENLTGAQFDNVKGDRISAGDSKTYTATYVVTEEDAERGEINNTINWTLDPDDHNPIEDTTEDPEDDLLYPHLKVEKSDTNTDPDKKYALGEEIKYQITVTNDGNAKLEGIEVKDVMSHIDGTPVTGTGKLTNEDGTAFTGTVDLEPEDSVTLYYTYTVTEEDLGKTLQNKATAIAKDPGDENKQVTDEDKTPGEETAERNPHLKVVKAVVNEGTGANGAFKLGEEIQYKVILTNDGNVTLNHVTIRDYFGATEDTSVFVGADVTSSLDGWSEFDGTLKPDEFVEFTYSYTVQESDLGKTIVNQVTDLNALDATNTPAGTNDDEGTVTSQTDDPDPDLAVEKKVVKDAGYEPTGKDENDNAVYALDDVIHYQITVSNTGNVTLTGVNVVDELLADGVKIHDLDVKGGDNITLAPKGHEGDSVTLYVDYTVKEEDLGKTLVNTVTVESDQTKPDPEDPNNDDHDETDGEKTEDPTPNMEVSKTVVGDKGSYRVGDVITYQITVKNTGNTTIHNVELMDVMQSANGRVTFTNLNGGKLVNGVPVLAALAPKTDWVVTCRYTVQMADADSDGTVISNKVTVDSDDGPNGEDPEDTTPGEPIDPIYTLTIKYQNGARVDLRDPDTVKLHAGDVYTVVAPSINGYHLSDKAYAEFDFTMRDRDTTIVIIYAANPVEDDDDDPVVNPDNDPDETTEETTEETEDEVDPGVYIEDPDDYTLTPITEEEPPLADLDVGDHTCCIMHFLLMLAAMVVLGFYTDSKKKHQARIFELKRTLAMEKGKNPDGDNSQQS